MRFLSYFCFVLVFVALCASAQSADAFYVTVTLDPSSAKTAVNSMLSGSNVDWASNGDGLLQVNGSTETFASPALPNLQQQAVKVLRYPGGTLSDIYHWRDGIGALSSRGYEVNVYAPGSSQQVLMGTQEFLELCEALGAQPLITVNVMSGTASEAAAWVTYVNKQNLISSKTGKMLPKVKYWEIGNEPYLDNALYPKMTPADYASQAAAFLSAMKAADSTVMIGIVLHSDPSDSWNATVLQNLQGVKPSFNFVATHPAYLPYCMGSSSSYSNVTLYAASMTSSALVNSRLAWMRSQINQYYPSSSIPTAITEHSINFGSTLAQADYVQTLDGALYEADLLAMVAQRTDVLTAEHWSASQDTYFGGLDTGGNPRPVYYTLANFSKMQQGSIVPTTISTRATISSVTSDCTLSGGYTVPAMSGYTTISTANGNSVLHLMLLNKHSTYNAHVSLQINNLWSRSTALKAQYAQIGGSSTFDTTVTPQTGTLQFAAGAVPRVTIPPHSVLFFDISTQ
jgi:alpha-N-arabinofuranosidase